MSPSPAFFQPQLGRRRFTGFVFALICGLLCLLAILFLAAMLGFVVWKGGAHVTTAFLNSFDSTLFPEKAGIKGPLWGSIWLITLLAAVPTGVGAAIYLEEFANSNRLTRFIHLNISNLAGVPSVVYGLLGLAVFVRVFRFDRSVVSGGLTLALLVLPVVIIASREALAAVPKSIRLAAYAVGATRWQTVRAHVLPLALPGVMTGTILALSRAIGEAAPLLILGAIAYVTAVPQGPWDPFTAIPLQIAFWIERPDEEFHKLAAAAIIVLLAVLLPMNAVAVGVRAWRQRKKAQ